MTELNRRLFIGSVVAAGATAGVTMPALALAFNGVPSDLDQAKHIQRDIAEIVRSFMGDLNTPETRRAVAEAVHAVMGYHVVYDHVIVCDETNNTDERVRRGELWVDTAVKLRPDSVEFIYLPVRLVPKAA